MEQLKQELDFHITKSSNHRLADEILDRLYSVYPFNKFEYIISHLIAEKIIGAVVD